MREARAGGDPPNSGIEKAQTAHVGATMRRPGWCGSAVWQDASHQQLALIVAGMRPKKRAPRWAGSAETTSAEGERSARACTPVPEGRDVDRRSRERNANAGLRSGNAKSRAVSNHRPCSSMAALRIISSARRRREMSQCAKREREAPRRVAESKRSLHMSERQCADQAGAAVLKQRSASRWMERLNG